MIIKARKVSEVIILFKVVVFFGFNIPKNTTNSEEKEMPKEREKTNLYPVCVYMIKNKEIFKNHKIYEDILKDATLPDYTDISEDSDAHKLYHTLFNTYKFLTGKSVYKSNEDPCFPMGYDVMPCIDDRNDDEIAQEMSYWMAICYDYLYEGEKIDEFRINQYKRQLREIDVNKTFTLLDELVEKINAEYVESLAKCRENLWLEEDSKQAGGNKPEPTEYFKIQEGMYEACRRIILQMARRQYNDSMETLKWYRHIFHNGLYFPYHGFDIFLDPKCWFCNLYDIYIAWIYVDLCCNVIMQNVNRRLVVNPYLSHEDRKQRLNKLNECINKLVEKTEIYPIKINDEEKREENMFYFFAYYHMKDRFLQDIYMLKYLKEKCGDRQNVAEKYSLLNKDKQGNYFFYENLTQKDRYQYFTEEQEVSWRTFSDNIKKCETGITEFEERSGRNFKRKEIALKAFYRELYLDKTLFERQQSKTIFNKFINQKIMKTSAYYFIDEKINMGICRELGAIDEFWLKNSIQENLYHLVCKVLAELLPLNIMSAFDNVLEQLICEMKATLSMYMYSPKDKCHIWLPL